jgi:hypothetical protein
MFATGLGNRKYIAIFGDNIIKQGGILTFKYIFHGVPRG